MICESEVNQEILSRTDFCFNRTEFCFNRTEFYYFQARTGGSFYRFSQEP